MEFFKMIISTNHRVMYRRYLMNLFRNESVNIAYCLTGELEKMLGRLHRRHLESNEIGYCLSGGTEIFCWKSVFKRIFLIYFRIDENRMLTLRTSLQIFVF